MVFTTAGYNSGHRYRNFIKLGTTTVTSNGIDTKLRAVGTGSETLGSIDVLARAKPGT